MKNKLGKLKKKLILKKKRKKKGKVKKKIKKNGEESLWIIVVIHSEMYVRNNKSPHTV
jgi:hypothetical protein